MNPHQETLNVMVLSSYLYNTAPGARYRIEQWARNIPSHKARFTFLSFESPQLHEVLYKPGHTLLKGVEMGRCIARRFWDVLMRARKSDVAFIFREALPIGTSLLERALHALGVPIVYDFDDAIFLPAVSDVNKRYQWLKRPGKTGDICRISSHVTVGNPYLRDYAARLADNVTIIPSTVDTTAYLPKTDASTKGVPIIGWSGSMTTVSHLTGALEVLRALNTAFPFRLKVLGSGDFSASGLDTVSRHWTAASEIQEIQSFDIGIMPLPDDEWSKGKCGMKALLYMALGVPVVAAAVGANKTIIQDGVNGFLAATPREWAEKLLLLLRNEPLRKRLAVAGRRTVEARYSAQVHAPRLLEILQRAAKGRPS